MSRAGLSGSLRSAAALSLFALACASASCHKARPRGTQAACAVRSDCAQGELCTAGACVGCARSRDCALSELCDPVQRLCVLRPCFGTACLAHADCNLGQYCVQGLCLDPAHPLTAGGQICSVQLCAKDRDCNQGQRCNLRTFVCETDLGCTAFSPCAADQICNPGTGACDPSCTASTAEQVCGPTVPCLSGRCVQCASDADCGPGLTCDVASSRCVGPTSCVQSRDCLVGLFCDPAAQICGPARGPCTSNESCASDERCDTRTGACVSGACLADHFDPNATRAQAAPIAAGGYPQLTLCGPAEEDWFSLQLASGDTVQVVSTADPLGSFDLQLQNSSGVVLEEGALAVLHTVGSGGSYFVRARTNDASAVYGLRVAVLPGTACTHNPAGAHQSAQQAFPLSPGPHYGYAVCPGEASWFVLSVGSGQGVDATAQLDPTQGGALTLSLYGADAATLVAQDASGGATLHVAAGTAPAGILYLEVAGSSPSVQNQYDLTVRLTSP